MKKVLLFSNSSWNIYNFRLNFISYLQKNNFEVIIISPKDKYSVKLLEKGFNYKNININTNKISFFADIFLFFNLLKYIRYYNPNYIISFTIKPNLYTIVCSLFFKYKSIINITGLGTMYFKNFLLKSAYLFLYKLIIKNSDYTMFQNKYDKLLLTNRINKKYIILPGSGICLKDYKYKKKIKSKKITFSFIGRFLKEKGLNEYLQAAKIIKKKYTDITFEVIGNHDQKNSSSVNIDELNYYIKNNIIKLKKFTTDITSILTQVDCVVLPSYREGTSRVLLEAGSTGTPSITTDVPGCNNVIKNGFNGYLCKSTDVKSLVNCIINFYKLSYSEKIIMGKNARINIENNFDENIIFKKYIKILK